MSSTYQRHATRLRNGYNNPRDPQLWAALSEVVASISRDQAQIDQLLPILRQFAIDQTGAVSIDTLQIRTLLARITAAGGVATGVRKTVFAGSPYLVSVLDDAQFLADATAGIVVHTLPHAATVKLGREFTLKKIDTSANAVQFASVGGQTFDGAASPLSITVQYESRTVFSDGANWWIK